MARPEAADEPALVERSIAGDDAAIGALVDRYFGAMTCVALAIIGDSALAADIVQESWMRILPALKDFEQRASLRTWILKITANTARTHAARRPPLVELPDEPAVDPAAFNFIGRWREPPAPWWQGEQERALIERDLAARVLAHLDALPPPQRAVVYLRDVEQLDAAETCDTLGLTEANQRVLLHRGRARLRAALTAELVG
jgi:RNA polymerase sigma-70 factor (ECF subfamily)